MTKEEFKTKKEIINSKIRELNNEMVRLKKEYIEYNAKYPIGSKVCITTPASTYTKLDSLESVLVGTNYEGRYYYEVAFVMNGKWVCHNSKPIYWMPIPSFDEILEANRDVLERIKEKGD